MTIKTAADFVRLVESDDPEERQLAAWDDAPLPVWKSVIENYPDMRFWVAHNRTTPAEILRTLAGDSDWRVRHRIASRASCPGEILEMLSRDSHDSVASAVAGHPRTPVAAIQHLADHPWNQVREKAIRQLTERADEVDAK
ncbi:hypothetical protein ACFC0K_40900 [Streptomyces hydrogenans]|uniref:hypothetical protein n=1 Tax=Streptomyces hydrogenans TaxID=1873719 RepID=UPI0035DF30C9